MAEFSINNQVSESTQSTPFAATVGFSPRMSEGIGSGDRVSGESDAVELGESLPSLHHSLTAEMRWAQDRYEQGANPGRLPAPVLSVGDEV